MYFAHGGAWNELQNADGPFSGSFSGSFQGDGTNLTGVASPTGSYTGSFTGSMLVDDGSGSFSGSFEGDGSLLTGLSAGVSTTFSPTVRYVAHDEGSSRSDGGVEILSTGTVYGGLTWSRSSTTLTITSEGHGLSTGDYIVIQNMSTAYAYVSVTATDSDTLTCTVADSGGTSGDAGAYIPAFEVTSFDQDIITIASPSTGNCQVNSVQITTPTKTNSTLTVTMPTSISNGAGGNSSLYNQIPPVIQGWRLNNGTQNTSIAITLNTSTDYNQFDIGGLVSLVKNMIRLQF
jgi:hypothetical protein